MISKEYEVRLINADSYEDINTLMNELDNEKEFNGLFKSLEISQRNKYHKYTIKDHIMYTVLGVEKSKELRWAALLHDIGKRDAMTIDSHGIGHFIGHPKISRDLSINIVLALKRDLEYEDSTCLEILKLIELHDSLNFTKKSSIRIKKIRQFISENSIELTYKILKLKEADTNAQSELSIELKKEIGHSLIECIETVLKEKSAYTEKDLVINRNELIALGISEDDLDRVIYILLRNIWGEPKNNNYETLVKIVKQYRKK